MQIRRHRAYSAQLLSCVISVAFAVLQIVWTQEPSPDQPFTIATASNVDENVFAMRVLATRRLDSAGAASRLNFRLTDYLEAKEKLSTEPLHTIYRPVEV